MKTLIAFVLRQTVLVNLLFLLLMAVGVFAMFDLPVERYPNVKMGKVQITTIFPGASPQDVEKLVTDEIEDSLDDLESVEFIQSASFRERSQVTVKFIDDTDYEELFKELRLKVLSRMNELPAGVDPPDFTEIAVSEWLPAVSVNLVGNRSNRALTLMAEEMKLLLRRIEGVREVDIQGDYTREFHLALDPDALNRLGVTYDEVASALSGANVSIPAGDYENEAGEFVVVVDERFRDRADVVETVVRRDADGSFITVGDVVASARMGYREPFVISSVNGQDSVALRIKKADTGNALDILPQVEAVVARFAPRLAAEGVEVVLTQDQRIQIDDAISTLGNNLLVGIALVFVLIFVFMGLRNAILTVIGIPFAFLVTMVIMWLTGNSLNEITLFSFVLVSGIVVDDAIVVIENIYRHLQEGYSLYDSAVLGASEVAWPVVAATSTTVAAFLPMLMMTGSTGEFFAQIPIAITAAIAASLFECLIVLPPHFMDWPGAKTAQYKAQHVYDASHERAVMRVIRSGTNKIVGFTLRHRFLSLGAVVMAFVLAVAALGVSITGTMPLIRIKFFPDEYTTYFIDLEGPIATSVTQTSHKVKEISDFVEQGGQGQMRSATGFAGFYVNEDYEPVYGSNMGHIAVEMPVKENQQFPDNPQNDPIAHLDYMRDALAPFEEGGWDVRVRPEPGGPPSGKDITIRVVGPNEENVYRLAERMNAFLLQDEAIGPHIVDLDDDRGTPSRVVRFRVDEKRAAEYGLSVADVARLAGSVLDGRFVGEFRTSTEDVDLRLKIDEAYLTQPASALAVPLLQHPSGPVRLGDLATMLSYMEDNQQNRYQGNRAVTLSANLRPGAPTSTPAVVARVNGHYETIADDYPGAELSFAGEFETTQRSYVSLTYAFFVAILVIYLILATQFRSYLQPAIILSAVVFSLIGVVFGKFVTQGLFTVNSFIATVGVTGVVVNDSLVLIDFINRNYAKGMSRKEAIIDGIRVRLRPILLTTLTTTLGLLPMAIGFPTYSVVWGTMASTFVTGLFTATFLTLFIVPIEWDMLMGFHLWLARRRENKENGRA